MKFEINVLIFIKSVTTNAIDNITFNTFYFIQKFLIKMS